MNTKCTWFFNWRIKFGASALDSSIEESSAFFQTWFFNSIEFEESSSTWFFNWRIKCGRFKLDSSIEEPSAILYTWNFHFSIYVYVYLGDDTWFIFNNQLAISNNPRYLKTECFNHMVLGYLLLHYMTDQHKLPAGLLHIWACARDDTKLVRTRTGPSLRRHEP